MQMQIAVSKKREYIQWFTDTCRIKEEKCRALLELFLQSDFLLERISLVENVRFMPDAILISAQGTKTVSYLCRLNGRHMEDIEAIIYELMTNPPERIFLWLNFSMDNLTKLVSQVIEGSSEEKLEQQFLASLNRIEEEKAYITKGREVKKEELLALIDEALSKGDRISFEKLSKSYKELFEKNDEIA